MKHTIRTAVGVLCLVVAGCGVSGPRQELTTLTPGLRIDRINGVVEFDGQIAVDVHHPDTPLVWLELFVTGPDSREHESLVVTGVPPSLIHAAMLAAGFEAGSPGEITVNTDGEIERHTPTGSLVRVEFVLIDEHGLEHTHNPADWIQNAETGEELAESDDWDGFVFAGSREVSRQGRTIYDADGTGVIVGLTTFGSEVIAPVMTLSHASAVDPAVWIAKNQSVPERGTRVRVRVWRSKR